MIRWRRRRPAAPNRAASNSENSPQKRAKGHPRGQPDLADEALAVAEKQIYADAVAYETAPQLASLSSDAFLRSH